MITVNDLSIRSDTLPTDPHIPVLDIDPYDLDVIDDPYQFDRMLRDAGPIVWLKKYGMYAVGRFAEAQEVFSDDSRFLCTAGVGLTDIRKPESLREQNPLMEVAPEVHRYVRSAMMKILSPAVLRTYRSRFQAKAHDYVDRIIDMGSFDGVHDFVEPYILDVFPETVGITINPDTVLLFGDLNFNANGPLNDLYRDAYKRVEKFLPDFEKAFRRENMTPGGVGDQLYHAEDAGIFESGTAFGFIRVLFRGGFDTTIAGINSALLGMSQDPAAWRWLKENPDKVLNAFDEGLRQVSPFRVSHRVTIPDGCEFAGVKLEGDRKVGIFMEAANRDPRKWADPDSFRIQRADVGQHVAFGHGAHKCIGLLLARYEAEALLGAVVARLERLEYIGAGEVSYKRVNTLRTLKDLPLRAIS